MGIIWTKNGRGCPAGTGGHPESGTPSKVRSQALVCWSIAISKSIFTKKIRVNPPLKNRLQTVVVEGEKSSFQIVISGVPQGTVLGPILFILYIDDQLDTLLTALGKVFADDTKLISKIADLVARCLLQEDLFNVIQWALQNNMQLNETKFEVINYKLNKSLLLRELPFSNEDYSYSLTNGDTIEPTQTVRDLGVLLSNDCSWTPHIHQMLKTAKKMASWVFSVFRDRSPFLMLTLFKTMVRSRLEYCCPVWNPSKITDIEASKMFRGTTLAAS